MRELTLGRLKHYTFSGKYDSFFSIYEKLLLHDTLSDEDKCIILAIVVLFINQSEQAMQMLGYRMALVYGNKTDDYAPLYDLAVNRGLIPVVALLHEIKIPPVKNKPENNGSFLVNIVDGYINSFRSHKIVLTEQQFVLKHFFENSLAESSAIIAPTSYGKTDLIISAIKKAMRQKICVIVPSKSLLAQTKKRILDTNIEWVKRIVTHPEMHRNGDDSAIYLLTQERLLAILSKDKKMCFDIVIVDEAHNILNKSDRDILLASVIKILEHRNKNTSFKYLTPFLNDASSLNIRNSARRPVQYKIDEYIKSELLYIADYRKDKTTVRLYDHFLNVYMEVKDRSPDYISYIHDHSANKNIIYMNKPKDIQRFAKKLANTLPKITSSIVEEAVNEIRSYTDIEYALLHCIKHGVLYHHGSMADPIRHYVEYLYRNCREIRYLISNSTLLEGVNLPAERMFLLSIHRGPGYLRQSHFRNLIGRINRFSEIFSSPSIESLKKLQPEIHIVATEEYIKQNANLDGFVEKVMKVSTEVEDKVENILLEGTNINDANQKEYNAVMTRLENLEAGIADGHNYPTVNTEVGMKLLENNVYEIDVFKNEYAIDEVLKLNANKDNPINSSNELIEIIYEAFVSFVEPQNNMTRNNLLRLKNSKTRTFYAMFSNWIIEQVSLPVMIHRFVKYWEQLAEDTPVYVGNWGDTIYGDGHLELFTYIRKKSHNEKVNLAIVRIKEEEDFYSYVLFRFVEVLNSLGYIDETFYRLAKYGSNDPKVIILIKNGFSRVVSELLITEYSNYILFEDNETVRIKPQIFKKLQDNKLGYLQQHEILFNVAQVEP